METGGDQFDGGDEFDVLADTAYELANMKKAVSENKAMKSFRGQVSNLENIMQSFMSKICSKEQKPKVFFFCRF